MIYMYKDNIIFQFITFFSLLSPYSPPESFVKKQILLTGFELSTDNSFLRLLSKSSLPFLHDYVRNCQEKC